MYIKSFFTVSGQNTNRGYRTPPEILPEQVHFIEEGDEDDLKYWDLSLLVSSALDEKDEQEQMEK